MSKRVFQLRKKLDAGSSAISEQPPPAAVSTKQPVSLENKSHISSHTTKQQQEAENFSQRAEEQQEATNLISLGPKLLINRSYIHFQKIVGQVDLKQVSISNIGSSAIYYEWVRLPRTRINPQAVLDETPKFFCHHDKNVIKPGESISFVFSFLAQLPGIFIEEYEFRCQPALITPLPILKLEGKAIIIDEFEAQRKKHSAELTKSFLQKNVREILSDMVDSIKSPEEPPPDMSDPKIAAKQFEKVNENYGVYHNQLVFGWWKGLYNETAEKLGVPESKRYWNGDIDTLKKLIQQLPDEVDKECFSERLANYLQWSRSKRPDQSPLYGSVRDMLCKQLLSIAGEFNDTARKQLEMWQIPWKAPIDPPNEAEKKARDEEVSKIKAEWLKKAKKKKWGEEEQKAMIADFRSRVEGRSKESMLNAFEQLDKCADYTSIDALAIKQPLQKQYFRWLERMKTIKQTEVEGRKVLLKVQLRLRPGGQAKLPELHEYLVKRKQYERKLEEQKKEQQGKDKKKAKKAAKKKQQQLVAPEFDMMSVLEEQSCKQIVDMVKNLQERSPKILIVACSFGPKRGIPLADFGLEFFWEYLRQLTDPASLFIKLNELPQLNDRMQNDFYPEGSTLILENINFLPTEAMATEEDGKFVRPLMHEISNGVRQLEQVTDVFVNDNRSEKQSGLALYLRKENVLGLAWWKQIGVALKAENSDLIISGKLTPQKLKLVEASIWFAKRVFLLGDIGVKFAVVRSSRQGVLNLKLSEAEKKAISIVLKRITAEWEPDVPKHKKSPEPHRAEFIYPEDVLIGEAEGDWSTIASKVKSVRLEAQHPDDKSHVVLDVGQQTVDKLLQYVNSSKHVFLLDRLPIDNRSLFATQQLFKHFYKLREARAARHQQQQKKGINYRLDTIITMVGDFDQDAQRVQLKEKPVRQQEELEEQPEQEKPEDEGEPVRNLTLLQDFTLPTSDYPIRLLTGEYLPSLSNITKYPKSDD